MRKGLRNVFWCISLILVSCMVYFTAIIIQARIGTPGIIKQALNAGNLTLQVSELSPWQLRALLAVEDPNFYHHQGVDLRTPGAGITTITQGLVKIYYFEKFKPGLAKLKQTLIARYALDPLVAKNDQLRLFINNIYLGSIDGKAIIGLDQAAGAYYHKQIHDLSQTEYLSLIAMIIAPQNFHILDRPAANAERTRRIALVVSGAYHPKQLMDIYYGRLDRITRKGLPPASYFPAIYDSK